MYDVHFFSKNFQPYRKLQQFSLLRANYAKVHSINTLIPTEWSYIKNNIKQINLCKLNPIMCIKICIIYLFLFLFIKSIHHHQSPAKRGTNKPDTIKNGFHSKNHSNKLLDDLCMKIIFYYGLLLCHLQANHHFADGHFSYSTIFIFANFWKRSVKLYSSFTLENLERSIYMLALFLHIIIYIQDRIGTFNKFYSVLH